MKSIELNVCVEGWIRTECLRLGLELDVFGKIGARTRGADKLADETGLSPSVMKALLESFVAAGLLTKTRSAYRNPAETRRLFEPGSPEYLGPHLAWLDTVIAPRLRKALGKKGRPNPIGVHGRLHGRRAGPVRQASPQLIARYSGFLAPLTYRSSREAAGRLPLGGARTIVDLGGNDGSFLIPLLLANRQLHGTIVDLAAVKGRARARIASEGLKGRLAFHAQNFFEGTLPKATLTRAVRFFTTGPTQFRRFF